MSLNDSPAKTPFSISRDKATPFAEYWKPGLESILGKRNSGHPPPAGAKRRTTTFPSENERLNEKDYGSPRPGSLSSASSGLHGEDHERSDHDKSVDVNNGLSSFPYDKAKVRHQFQCSFRSSMPRSDASEMQVLLYLR